MTARIIPFPGPAVALSPTGSPLRLKAASSTHLTVIFPSALPPSHVEFRGKKWIYRDTWVSRNCATYVPEASP